MLLQITNLMQQSPSWEANCHSTSQEIPYILWNLKVHKSQPLVHILSQLNPINTFPPFFSKIRSNIIPSFLKDPSDFEALRNMVSGKEL
jgi:hypothetical protein